MAETGLSGLVLTEFLRESVSDALTAHAGGTQAAALQLVSQINRVTTVATAADSVKLPGTSVPGSIPSSPWIINPVGLTVRIINAGANALQVFGAGTDTINGVATATGVSQPAGTVVSYTCTSYASGVAAWITGALGGTNTGDFTVTGNLIFSAAAARIIPGVTSLSIRNNANSGTNLGITDAGAVSLTGSAATLTVTSAQAAAFAVGLAGATNPALNVDASTAASATGLNIKSAAAGGGLALSVISSGGAENLTIDAKSTGTITIGGVSTGQISLGRASLKTVLFSSTISGLGTVQNSTPTAAQLLGGVVTQTGATGAGTVTTPTGTVLSAAIPGVAIGDTFDTIFANLGGGFNLTITAGASGMTVVGNAVVPSGKNALLVFVNTGANTWNCYVSVSA